MNRLTKIALLALAAWLGGGSAAMAQQEFKRDLEQVTFIPKGQWITGVSVNYAHSDQDNYDFFILENLSGDAYQFKVSPMLFYSFKDNMAAGGKLSFARTRAHIDKGSLKLDSETHYDADNLFQVSNQYSATAAFEIISRLAAANVSVCLTRSSSSLEEVSQNLPMDVVMTCRVHLRKTSP